MPDNTLNTRKAAAFRVFFRAGQPAAAKITLEQGLASIILWVRSYWVREEWFVALAHGHNIASYTYADLGTASGCCEILVQRTFNRDATGDWGHEIFDSLPDIDDPSRNRFGVEWLGGGPFGGNAVVFPLWYGVIAFALTPTLHLFLRRRRRPGTCEQCSYDLTGNTSGVCPECGTQIPARR